MKKAIFIAFIIGLIFIIINLVHSIYTIWHKQDLIVQAQNQLNAEKTENKNLKQQLFIAQSKAFIEEQARDKLFLSKPGEEEIILPQQNNNISNFTISNFTDKQNESLANLPIWRKGLRIFFD